METLTENHHPMITPDQLRDLPKGTTLHHVSLRGSDRLPLRCRTSGRLKEWRRDPSRWEQPVKRGLQDSFHIGPYNAADWELPTAPAE